ncbi:MAG: nucleotidyltransferase substrate binding protein [Nitrospiria bacterium]
MKNEDIRWIQRFANFSKAFKQLTKFIEKGALNELEELGLIQSFEHTHDLAWKTLKDFLENKGNRDIYGSRDATRAAFKLGLIKDGETWMDMIKSRNETTHSYNEETTKKIAAAIFEHYYTAFLELKNKLTVLKEQETS